MDKLPRTKTGETVHPEIIAKTHNRSVRPEQENGQNKLVCLQAIAGWVATYVLLDWLIMVPEEDTINART